MNTRSSLKVPLCVMPAMSTTDDKSLRSNIRGSLRLRLTVAVVLIVLVFTGAGMILDYRREYRVHMDGLWASLTEQAQALRVARKQIKQPARFARYINDFCAQMNEHISPGHHVLVLDAHGRILASTRYHSGPAVEKVLLNAGSEKKIYTVNGHKLIHVSLKDDDGATIILAQYLDHVQSILRRQLMSRAVNTGSTALAIIVLIFLALHFWSIQPIKRLVEVAEAWSARVFSVRAEVSGPSEIRLLASKFNLMAEELERHEYRRTAELERAKQIQANLLPTSIPALQGLTVAAEYRPVDHVAGDLYDVFELPGGKIAFVILDVAGHGITAALLTGVVKMSLHRRFAEQADPAAAMSLVNEDLLHCVSDGQFITACVGVWRHEDRTWTYCGAGHLGGLLSSSERVLHLPPTGPLLGVIADAQWSCRTIKLHEGDRLFLYTDGVIDAGSPDNRLAQVGLEAIVRQSAEKSLTEQLALIMDKVSARDSGHPQDDATVLAVEGRWHEQAASSDSSAR